MRLTSFGGLREAVLSKAYMMPMFTASYSRAKESRSGWAPADVIVGGKVKLGRLPVQGKYVIRSRHRSTS